MMQNFWGAILFLLVCSIGIFGLEAEAAGDIATSTQETPLMNLDPGTLYRKLIETVKPAKLVSVDYSGFAAAFATTSKELLVDANEKLIVWTGVNAYAVISATAHSFSIFIEFLRGFMARF